MFARLGQVRTLPPGQTDPDLLREAIVGALASPREAIAARARSALGLGGARAGADQFLELAAGAP